METKLFVIKQRGRNLYWTCSAEHGSGWSEPNPKQSFSPSELVKEIRRLIDEKWFTDIEVLELRIGEPNGGPCEADMPGGAMMGKSFQKHGARCPMCGR